jgi:hypothetical protein
MNYKKYWYVLFLLLLIGCRQNGKNMIYQINKLENPVEINAVWDKPPWNTIGAIELTHYMGERPDHFPVTQVKAAYDEEAIYIIFHVEDQYVKAIHTENQDAVYKDSCVEFFFIPDGEIEKGYFNLEMNCGGAMLFHHQIKPRSGSEAIRPEHISQIDVATTLPKMVDPEIEEKTTWVVEYRIPFSILKPYHDFSNPSGGATWRANIYKCADETSHPHWITWAPVKHPVPNFHLPEYFGTLKF